MSWKGGQGWVCLVTVFRVMDWRSWMGLVRRYMEGPGAVLRSGHGSIEHGEVGMVPASRVSFSRGGRVW